MADFLGEKREEITRRLQELEPLVEEYSRLEAAAGALAGLDGASTRGSGRTGSRKRRGPGRPRGSGSKRAPARKASARATESEAAGGASGKRGRPARKRGGGRQKGSGTRAAEALAAVKEQPGITIKELGAKLGISPNYMYRVLPGLEKEKKVKKQGNGWHATS